MLDEHTHSHVFDHGNPLVERNSKWALLLTLVIMLAEIIGGWLYHSMALLADGWHMSSHALALGLSVLAYVAARHFARDSRFSFGTWKIEVLAGYSSALFLLGIALLMLVQSVERLLQPLSIDYPQAIFLATLGLLVNLVCAWLLKDDHAEHGHHHHHHDLNQQAAYLHMLTDAATSVLAIIALLGGLWWGAYWLDPLMGIVGGVLVAIWAVGLLKESAGVLLDAEMDAPVVTQIKTAIVDAKLDAELLDLHVWRVGKGQYACIVSLTCKQTISAEQVKQHLRVHEELVHITVELNCR